MNLFPHRGLHQIICLLLVNGVVLAQPYERPLETDPAIQFANANYHNYQIHYAYAGAIDKPGILFIHGTPGGWPAFEMYLSNKELQKDFFMVSVDRLGWGGSNVSAQQSNNQMQRAPHEDGIGDELLNFTLQAGSIAAVMKLYSHKKWLLVGHSLGASIAPKVVLLADHKTEQLVTGMLLLAGSLDPKLGQPRWFNRAANTRLVRWLLPDELRYSNDEIMALRRELRVIESELFERQLDTEVVIMQGMKDKLVSPKNPGYVMRVWSDNFAKLRTLELAEAGHFLPWRQTELVIQTIRQFKF